ncbi:MAG: tyrosine-type recombinase/integrase [Acidobacteria bacterium]|nr:tyrosine-type recombinase/integrase [Acidobacteriota bacterium]
MCQRYSRTTLKVYERVSTQFMEFWGNEPLSKVRPSDVQDFLIERSVRDLSADVVRRYLWGLRSFFDFMCLRGITDDVAPRLVRPRPMELPAPRALSKQNALRLIEAANNVRDRAMLELFYATGCRISELANVRLEHVDLAKGTIWIHGKGGRSRRVFFGPIAKRYLEKYLRGRREGFLFESQYLVQKGCVSWNGRYWAGYWKDYTDPRNPHDRCKCLGPKSLGRKKALEKFKQLVPDPDRGHIRRKPHALGRGCISNIFREAAMRSGLAKVTSHNLRHSFAVHMLDNGADVRQVQELLGHTSLATTHRYARVASVPASKAYKQFHPRAKKGT